VEYRAVTVPAYLDSVGLANVVGFVAPAYLVATVAAYSAYVGAAAAAGLVNEQILLIAAAAVVAFALSKDGCRLHLVGPYLSLIDVTEFVESSFRASEQVAAPELVVVVVAVVVKGVLTAAVIEDYFVLHLLPTFSF